MVVLTDKVCLDIDAGASKIEICQNAGTLHRELSIKPPQQSHPCQIGVCLLSAMQCSATNPACLPSKEYMLSVSFISLQHAETLWFETHTSRMANTSRT